MNHVFLPLNQWGVQLNDHHQMLIAGPCAAESAEQLLETARALSTQQLTYFRAGVWKPRTHPGCFEGAGDIAFDWLEAVRKETGLPFIVEVANARHVQTALAHHVDAVWLGARTTVTPFAVQEIADALHGHDIPVFVKNPVNPDIELWIGAIERLARAGLSRIGVILRGCSGITPGKYRNAPAWNLAIELKQRLPQLPCICDPSHMAGKTEYIQELSQEAINLDFQGLMIETHAHPEQALSDSSQQMTPRQLADMIQSLIQRSLNSGNPSGQLKLDELRLEIDQLDLTLISTLARRMNVSRDIGICKRDNGITVLQTSRWEKVLAKAVERGQKLGLSEAFITDLFNRIHIESINQQQ